MECGSRSCLWLLSQSLPGLAICSMTIEYSRKSKRPLDPPLVWKPQQRTAKLKRRPQQIASTHRSSFARRCAAVRTIT
jgi:hypothetical protein